MKDCECEVHRRHRLMKNCASWPRTLVVVDEVSDVGEEVYEKIERTLRDKPALVKIRRQEEP